jgi:hypothetical protein
MEELGSVAWLDRACSAGHVENSRGRSRGHCRDMLVVLRGTNALLGWRRSMVLQRGEEGRGANGLESRSCFRRAGLIEAPLVSYCYINEVF